MADMTWGPEYTWPVLPAVHQASQFQSCRLSATKFVMAYVYFSTHGADTANLEGRALVGVVSGTAISYGADAVFRQPMGTQVTPLAICRLDDNKFVVFYKPRDDGLVDEPGWARVGVVSGNSISWGDAVNITNSNARYLSCVGLSSTKFVCEYLDKGAGNKSAVCICTVSGNTITPGSPSLAIIPAAIGDSVDLTKVDTDKFVGVWRDGITTDLFGAVFTVSGTTPSKGTTLNIDAGSCYQVNITYLGNNKVVATWNEGALFINRHGQVVVLTISGTTLTKGDIVETQAASGEGQGPYSPDVVAVGENNFLFVYSLAADGTDRGVSKWCSVAGTVITVGSQEIWSANSIGPKDVLYLAGDKVALPFIEGLSGPEKAIIGTCLKYFLLWGGGGDIAVVEERLHWKEEDGSNEVYILGALVGASTVVAGNLAVVEERLHYVDASGNERYWVGTLIGDAVNDKGNISVVEGRIHYVNGSGKECYIVGIPV